MHYIQHHFPFVRPQNGIAVELHYRIREHYFAVAFDTTSLFQHLREIQLGNRPVQSLSFNDTLLTLCVHGASHAWGCLFWVSDIAELLRRNEGIDWPLLFEQARKLGCVRMVLTGLLLAAELFDAQLPPPVLAQASADTTARELANEIASRLRSSSGEVTVTNVDVHFQLRSRDHWRDQLSYSLRLALTPTEGDWSVVALPRNLSFLYYLLRPFRLVWTYGTQRLRRS